MSWERADFISCLFSSWIQLKSLCNFRHTYPFQKEQPLQLDWLQWWPITIIFWWDWISCFILMLLLIYRLIWCSIAVFFLYVQTCLYSHTYTRICTCIYVYICVGLCTCVHASVWSWRDHYIWNLMHLCEWATSYMVKLIM